MPSPISRHRERHGRVTPILTPVRHDDHWQGCHAQPQQSVSFPWFSYRERFRWSPQGSRGGREADRRGVDASEVVTAAVQRLVAGADLVRDQLADSHRRDGASGDALAAVRRERC